MKRKAVSWIAVTLVTAIAFIGFSSFSDEGEAALKNCKKSKVSTDYCTARGGSIAGCSNTTGTDNSCP